MKSPDVIAAQHQLELYKKWVAAKAVIPKGAIEAEIVSYIKENAGNLVESGKVRSNQIPNDDNEARVAMYGEVAEIELADFVDWGNGWLMIPVKFKMTDSLIDFFVYKLDSFDLPDWVSVTHGDFEEDHYFDAEGQVDLEVSVELTVQIDIRDTYNDDEPVIKEIQMNGAPEIGIVSDESAAEY